MNLLPSEEQSLVIQAISSTIERIAPFQRLFGTKPAFEGARLSLAAAEGGWYGLSLSEEAGGVGYSIVEEVLLARELGRAVAPLSIHATAIAAHIASQANDAALAARFAKGDVKASFAIALGGAAGRHLLLDHDKVAYGLLLGERLTLVDIASLSPSPAPVTCLDPTVTAAEIFVSGQEKTLCAHDGALFLETRVLIAAHMIGIAERARDLAVEYAGSRVQFGRPIGSFQAIKHRCSDIATRCELAWAQICAAAVVLNEGRGDAALHAAAAYTVAEDATTEAIRGAVQIHGGIGVTAEHALHILMKRHHVLAQLGAGRDLEAVLLS